jgi:hypothetical protein
MAVTVVEANVEVGDDSDTLCSLTVITIFAYCQDVHQRRVTLCIATPSADENKDSNLISSIEWSSFGWRD